MELDQWTRLHKTVWVGWPIQWGTSLPLMNPVELPLCWAIYNIMFQEKRWSGLPWVSCYMHGSLDLWLCRVPANVLNDSMVTGAKWRFEICVSVLSILWLLLLFITSLNLLYTKKVIDQIPLTRQILAHGVAQQFFGCFISMTSWSVIYLH